MKVLVLRPQPGADETAARALALGLEPVVCPLFTLRPLAWTPPDPAGFDAVMLTSASAARCGGDALTSYAALPCYAVGEASAAAARDAGFADVRTGPDDGASLLLMMAADGAARVFHPCGRDHLAIDQPGVVATRVPVYASEAAPELAEAAVAALAGGAIALLHSPRAAAHFAALVQDKAGIALAAISARTARAAGDGWRAIAIAPAPRDHALLELAAKLCQMRGEA
jgi:uroporphyrinogen-III synthase